MAPERDEGIQIERSADHGIRLKGQLSVDTIPGVLNRSDEWFQGQSSLSVDLSGIDHSDSAGVALLLEWLRRAREQGCRLQYRNLPRQMRAIVDFGDLGDILPLEKSQQGES